MTDSQPLSVWRVDKPAGPTSHDIVDRARRTLGRGVKVGHTGTLDPFASGLLVVLVGRATRLARFFSGLDKTYQAGVRLGAVSDSGDSDGTVSATGAPVPSDAEVREALEGFRGVQRQRVPELSAVKVDGDRLYRRTRRGEQVDLPEREITVHEIALRSGPDEQGVARIDVRCSAGTYIRRLATDLGERLDCGAYCAALRRTAVGGLSVEGAVGPDDVRPSGGTELRTALAHLPAHELSVDEAELVKHGRAVPGDGCGTVALWQADRLVAMADGEGGSLHPRVVVA